MPELIAVNEFVKESWDDYNSPTTSNFVPRMGHCRNSVSSLEEMLDLDRSGLTKMKKSVKALYSSGSMHVSNESYLAENLEKLGNNALSREHERDIGAAFLKFAVVTKELSALMKNLMQNLNNILMFPLDSFLKGDLRGVKGDLKKPFDKSWKEYDAKFNKIEKEKKQLAKDAGMVRTEITGAEIAEEMEKERRMFQLQMCEYLIKVNEIKTKKGVDLLQHLVEYYQAQTNYFQDGMKTIEHFKCYIEELVGQLSRIKQRQDAERRQLIELRDALKSSMSVYKELSDMLTKDESQAPAKSSANQSGYCLHQLQGNKAHGNEKTGHLLKKSEGMRKVWQRRKCSIKDGFLSISHSDVTKEPVKLNLLTCQVKVVDPLQAPMSPGFRKRWSDLTQDDPGKKCFDLISSSKNRTYHFQAEDQEDMEEWISVLNNAKEAVLMKAFGESSGNEANPMSQSVKELTRTIIQETRRLPGNRLCADCSATDPEWLSVNLGVLICLECCGVHREMGVHISRTQSIFIDDLATSQLLLVRVVSNRGFNDIMEATLDTKIKPVPTSTMEEKKTFIRAKYEKRKYAIVTCTDLEDRRQDLRQAILSRDIFALLQVFAEGIDFMEPLPDSENGETALHMAIRQEDGTSLPLVDFMIQNTNSQHLQRPDACGQTALHVCALYQQTECMKLLLRVRPDLAELENDEGQTALELARELHSDTCVELLSHALTGKTELFENVNIDWNLISDDHLLYDAVDYSDDDLDSGAMTPDRRARSRPGSLVMASESTMPLPLVTAPRERSHTGDSLKAPSTSLPPPPPPQANKPKYTVPPPAGQAGYVSTAQAMCTLPKKKAPAPPPPSCQQGHQRNPSDPCLTLPRATHVRTPSDPPPLPAKTTGAPPYHRAQLPGAKLVLPPPPEFDGDQGLRPQAAPRTSRTPDSNSNSSSLVTNPAYENVRLLNNNRPQEGARSISPQTAKMASFGDSRQSSTSSESSRYGSSAVPSKVMNPVYELQTKRQRRTSADEGSSAATAGKSSNPIYESTTTVPKTTSPIYAELQPRTPGSETAAASVLPTDSTSSMVAALTTLASTTVALTSTTTPHTASSSVAVAKTSRPRSAGAEDNRPPITAPKPKLAAKPIARPGSFSAGTIGGGGGSAAGGTALATGGSAWSRAEKRYSTSSALSSESTRSEHRMSIDSVKSDNRMSTASSLSENRMSSGSDSSQNYPLGASVTPVAVGSQALSAIPVMEGNAKVMNLAQLKVNGQSRSSDSLESTDSGSSAHKLAVNEPTPIPTPRQRRKGKHRQRRCKALYDCEADNEDELSFQEGEVIVIVREEEEDWWEGHILGHPDRRGMFPSTFVSVIGD